MAKRRQQPRYYAKPNEFAQWIQAGIDFWAKEEAKRQVERKQTGRIGSNPASNYEGGEST